MYAFSSLFHEGRSLGNHFLIIRLSLALWLSWSLNIGYCRRFQRCLLAWNVFKGLIHNVNNNCRILDWLDQLWYVKDYCKVTTRFVGVFAFPTEIYVAFAMHFIGLKVQSCVIRLFTLLLCGFETFECITNGLFEPELWFNIEVPWLLLIRLVWINC